MHEIINTGQAEYNDLTFRGKPIKWTFKNKSKTVTVDDPFDGKTQEERNELNNLINYEDNTYTRGQFLKTFFSEYKKYKYRVAFNNDNVFWLSGNQRAKLQYHILAQNFELVEIDEQDQKDLYNLCEHHKTETAQRWLHRMKWKYGHQAIISFGVSLDVRRPKDENGKSTSNVNGVYCYDENITNTQAAFCGVRMSWEVWQSEIIKKVDDCRPYLNKTPKHKQNKFIQNIYNDVIMSVYYQDKIHLTLPQDETEKITSWLYQYIKNGKAEFPYKGEIPNADIKFTIDFKRDVKIEKQHDNTKHNQDMARDKVLKTFSRLVGDVWTTQEILQQGFNEKNIKRFVEYGLIVRIARGHYKRV